MMEADGNCNSNGYGTDPSNDEGDALGNTRFPQANVVARMSTERNARYYKMDHKKRGLALLFNHENFKVPGLKQRSGTQVDCQNFKSQLERLGFLVEVYNDLDHQDVNLRVNQATKVNYTDYDCFLLAVLSHGDKGILYARDNGYKPESLWGAFTADNVPTLAGKPKMFFIQACQGDQLDRGVTLSRTETDGSPHSYRIPTHADFLIAYSTISGNNMDLEIDELQKLNVVSPGGSDDTSEGYFSWRNTTRGSWFIQALCDELEVNGFDEDILSLLTSVSRRVALDYESNTPDTPHMHGQKQIPCVTTMLTRLVKFTRRS